MPITVFEMDGGHHATEEQQKRDQRKERMLAAHGIRLWRMWNPKLGKVWGCNFEDLLEREHEEMHPECSRLFRRDIKAHMYTPYGTLASDWMRLCPKCSKEGWHARLATYATTASPTAPTRSPS